MSLNRKSLFKRRDSVAAYMTNDSVKVDGNITIITCKVHAKKKMTPTEMESYYKNFPEDLIEKFARKALPAVIPVPSPGESSDDFATQRLRKIVERAVGSDILG